MRSPACATAASVFEDYDFGDEATIAGILSDADGPVNAWFTDSEGNSLAIAEDR